MRRSGFPVRPWSVTWCHIVLVSALLSAGCSSHKPILYPNEHLEQVGETVAEDDIASCEEAAEAAGTASDRGKGGELAARTATGAGVGAAGGAAGGAVGGAIRGNAGRGAGIGAAAGAAGGATRGLLRGLFGRSKPNRAHMNYVDRCLRDRGYDVVGWK